MILMQDIYLFLIFFFFIIILKIILDFLLKKRKWHTERFHKEKWKGLGKGLLSKKKNPEVKDTTHICKKCGAVMVEMQHDLDQFYGCSNYPKCTYRIR